MGTNPIFPLMSVRSSFFIWKVEEKILTLKFILKTTLHEIECVEHITLLVTSNLLPLYFSSVSCADTN